MPTDWGEEPLCKGLLGIALMIVFFWGGVNGAHLSDLNVKTNILFTTSYLKVVDYATRYVGYYADDHHTMVFTSVSGNGQPYWVLIGFSDELNGKTVTVTCDNADFGFSSKNFKIAPCYNGEGDWKDVEGKTWSEGVLGFDMRHGIAPSGTYNFEIHYRAYA